MTIKKILPFLLSIVFIINVIMIAKWVQDNKNKQTSEAALVERKDNKFGIDLSATNSELQNVSFHGVSFMCPASWVVQREVSAQGHMYELTCDDSTNANRTVHFMWMSMEVSPDEWIKDGLKEAQDKLGDKKVTVSSIKNYKFNSIKSKTVDFSYTQDDIKVFGKITSFNLKEGSCIVFMFNDAEIEEDADFYVIENSFVVE